MASLAPVEGLDDTCSDEERAESTSASCQSDGGHLAGGPKGAVGFLSHVARAKSAFALQATQ